MHPMLNIAVRAARAAGNLIVRYVDRVDALEVTAKGRNDFVSEVDREAERTIIGILHKAYPQHAILAEESGRRRGDADYEWIIDPLDGTTNFLHGFPQFAVSIALRHRGRIEQGVIYDPLRQEVFAATRGAGARLNDRRIRVSRCAMRDALLGTGFPFRNVAHLDEYLATFRALVPQCAGVRRAGSAALDLAWVAAGRLDGFWEFALEQWDVAAGALLVQEAGGMVNAPDGSDGYLEQGDIVAANPRVQKSLLQTLQSCRSARAAG